MGGAGGEGGLNSSNSQILHPDPDSRYDESFQLAQSMGERWVGALHSNYLALQFMGLESQMEEAYTDTLTGTWAGRIRQFSQEISKIVKILPDIKFHILCKCRISERAGVSGLVK